MHDEDRELARRMLAGDERAFAAFFDAHFDRLYRFARARLRGDAGAAEDAAQSALSKAVRKLSTYRGEASLYTWLCTFCRHEISAHVRKHGGSRAPVELVEDAPDVRAALESLDGAPIPEPEAALRRSEVARLVQVALDALPAHYGNALEWKYLDDLSVRAIAERLDVSPKAAESTLTRARDAFREAFRALLRGALTGRGTPEAPG